MRLSVLALSAGLLLATASAQAHTQPHAQKPTYMPASNCHEVAPLQAQPVVVVTCPAEAYVLPAVLPTAGHMDTPVAIAPDVPAMLHELFADEAPQKDVPPNRAKLNQVGTGKHGRSFLHRDPGRQR